MLSSSAPNNDLPLLPPPQAEIETVTVMRQVSKSAAALAELKGLAHTLTNPNILLNAVVLREAKASSEIENIVTTQDKLYQALTSPSQQNDPATKEVLFYREALLLGYRLITDKGFLNVNGIIAIQQELERNQAGLRRLPGTALVNDLTGDIIYTPPDDPEVIIQLMRNLEVYLNQQDDAPSPLIKMAIQHYQFESIHPFYDGNGRTGRIINVLYLILHGLLHDPILYLSSYIIRHKADYYRFLQEVRTMGRWEQWILFILVGVERTAVETITQIRQIHALFSETQALVQAKLPRIYSKDLIEQLFVHPYCKIEFLTESLKVERKAASRYLGALEGIGVLSPHGQGREKLFVHDKLFDLLRAL